MISTEFKAKTIMFNPCSYCEKWWAGETLLRVGSQEWYIYADNSYMNIAYIDSVEIENEYQNELIGQRDLFR